MIYLSSYPEHLVNSIKQLYLKDGLKSYLLSKYKCAHGIVTDKGLYDYTHTVKNSYMRQSGSVSKVVYDPKIQLVDQALGMHTFISRVQGGKLKAKNEIRIASLFRDLPEEFLRMIVVHELAHLKVKDHNKAFYQLCFHMEPSYAQYEFDLRVYLSYKDQLGKIW
jgi:predicted metal-dependent hydrolase